MIKGLLKYIIILISVYFLTFYLTSCIVVFKSRNNEEPAPEILLEGDWYYHLSINNNTTIAYIVGISDSAKQKEVLIIPNYINGVHVQSVTYSLDYCKDKTDTGKLKTIYSGKLACYNFSRAYNLEKVVLNVHRLEGSFYGHNPLEIGVDYGLTRIYVFNKYAKETTKAKIKRTQNLYYANVSFMYNYEGADNGGVYWLDNYDYRQKIGFIPENPVREGYTFGGWFKEEACENEWKFTIDRLPYKKVDQFGETLYQETRLYAKWIVNE